MKLTIATRNSDKAAEIGAALKAWPTLTAWSIKGLPADIADVEETGTAFVENAVLKAVHFSDRVEGLTLADDSGLCIDALDGRPGIFSARYAADDAARIARVLNEMKSVPTDKRGAAFVCALAVADRGKVVWTVERRITGCITEASGGTNGFGYDPIFWLPEFGCTMAALGLAAKNRISHRGQAIQALAQFLQS